MKKIVETKNLIIRLMKYKKQDFITVEYLLNFMEYLRNELYDQNMMDEYLMAYDINIGSIKKVIEYNADIFYNWLMFSPDDLNYSEKIYIKNPKLLEEYILKYTIDENIDEIMRRYCCEEIEEAPINNEPVPVLKKI